MKHPLLPENYVDAGLHRIILSALAPYERKTRESVPINNPAIKWDLSKAWDDAQPILQLSRWRSHGLRDEETPTVEWEMAADTEEEKENLYTVIAGIVARQILEPESGYALIRVVMKKGGEMQLFITGPMQQLLAEDPQYAQAKFDGIAAIEMTKGSRFSWNWLKRLFGFG